MRYESVIAELLMGDMYERKQHTSWEKKLERFFRKIPEKKMAENNSRAPPPHTPTQKKKEFPLKLRWSADSTYFYTIYVIVSDVSIM